MKSKPTKKSKPPPKRKSTLKSNSIPIESTPNPILNTSDNLIPRKHTEITAPKTTKSISDLDQRNANINSATMDARARIQAATEAQNEKNAAAIAAAAAAIPTNQPPPQAPSKQSDYQDESYGSALTQQHRSQSESGANLPDPEVLAKAVGGIAGGVGGFLSGGPAGVIPGIQTGLGAAENLIGIVKGPGNIADKTQQAAGLAGFNSLDQATDYISNLYHSGALEPLGLF